MTDREKLIEYIKQATILYLDYFESIDQKGLINTDGKAKFIADYLLKNGVIVLPCKLDNYIYDISEYIDGTHSPEMYECKAAYITMWKKYPDRNQVWFEIDGCDFTLDDIGKTVFLSREEAEKALAERNKL